MGPPWRTTYQEHVSPFDSLQEKNDGTLHRHYKDLTHHSPDSRQPPHPHAKHTDSILRHQHIWTLPSAIVASSVMSTELLAFIIEIHVLSHGLQLPVRGNPLSYLNQHVWAVTCKNWKRASGILTVLFINSYNYCRHIGSVASFISWCTAAATSLSVLDCCVWYRLH